MAVAGQVDQQRLRLAAGLAAQRFVDSGTDTVTGLGRGDDALGAGKHDTGFEGGHLRYRDRLDHFLVVQLRDQRRHAVVAQAASVNSRRHEIVAQGVHLHQRRIARGIAKVVGINALGQTRTRGRLHRHATQVLGALVTGSLVGEEGEADAGEIAAATAGRKDHVRVVAHLLELLLGFLADDGLVQQHMVQHRTERVIGVGARGRFFHRLGDGNTQAALVFRVVGQDAAAGLGKVGRAGEHFGAPGLHHRATEWFLLVRHLHHVDANLHVEHLSGQRQAATPLACTGLGGQPVDAGHFVVIGLWHRRVGLVRAGRRDAFVLVVNLARRAQNLLQPMRTEQG